MNWKPVKGYEGLYEVSETGLVRSLDRYIVASIRHVDKRLIKGKTLYQATKRNGYKTVDLCKNCKVKTTLVHRLVAEAFCPNPNGLRFVNHKDSDRTNNNASNLEWVTSSENRKHGITQGFVTFRQKAVLCIETGVVYDAPKYAAEWLQNTGKSNGKLSTVASNIRMACKGYRPTAYGFSWKYHEGSTTIL